MNKANAGEAGRGAASAVSGGLQGTSRLGGGRGSRSGAGTTFAVKGVTASFAMTILCGC